MTRHGSKVPTPILTKCFFLVRPIVWCNTKKNAVPISPFRGDLQKTSGRRVLPRQPSPLFARSSARQTRLREGDAVDGVEALAEMLLHRLGVPAAPALPEASMPGGEGGWKGVLVGFLAGLVGWFLVGVAVLWECIRPVCGEEQKEDRLIDRPKSFRTPNGLLGGVV